MLNSKHSTHVLACTLTDSEYKERRLKIRQQLIPYINKYERTELSLILVFNDSKVDRSMLERFVELEQQCCSFLNFVILQTSGQVSLTINGPAGAQSTLKAFAQAAGCVE